MDKEQMYYIANRSPVGNCIQWWAIDGHGYTCNLDKAWKVNYNKAKNICKDRPDIDKMYAAQIVEASVTKHVDFQILREVIEQL